MKTLAVICAGNTCRSPMIAALLRRKLGAEAEVISAGYLQAANLLSSAAPEWEELSGETGVDLGKHRSQHISELDLLGIDRFLAVENKVRDALIAAGAPAERVEVIEVSNPFLVRGEGRLDAYRTCFADAERVVGQFTI